MESTTADGFDKVKTKLNIIDYDNTLVAAETASLPGIQSLLDGMRHRDENPRQLPDKQTTSDTWHQFGICDERKTEREIFKCTFYPVNHDNPVFAVNSLRDKTQDLKGGGADLEVEVLANTEKNDGKDERKSNGPSEIMLECHAQENNTQERRNDEEKMGSTEEKSEKEHDGQVNSSQQTASSVILISPIKCTTTDNIESLEVENSSVKVPIRRASSSRIAAFTQIASPLKKSNSPNNFRMSPKANPLSLRSRQTREECLRELFSSLGILISCKTVTSDGQKVPRHKVLDSSAHFIRSLERKNQNIKLDIEQKKLILKEYMDDTENQKQQEEIISNESAPMKHDGSPKKALDNKGTISKDKITLASEKTRQPKYLSVETKADTTSKSQQGGKVKIIFVNEKNSSRVSDSTKKSIALFFGDVKNLEKNAGVNSKKNFEKNSVKNFWKNSAKNVRKNSGKKSEKISENSEKDLKKNSEKNSGENSEKNCEISENDFEKNSSENSEKSCEISEKNVEGNLEGNFEKSTGKDSEKTTKKIVGKNNLKCQKKLTETSQCKKNAKMKKKELEKLGKKAFIIYAKYWRPRLKKEMPVCSRVEITDLLKCRWEGLSRETKRRYRKMWEEQAQVKISTSGVVKSKTEPCPEQPEQATKSEQTSQSQKRPFSEQVKKTQDKITTKTSKGKIEQPLKKQKKESTTTDNDVVNWVQCDRCKNWRILPSDVDINTLSKRWFCRMNKDKAHNRCSIPQESYSVE